MFLFFILEVRHKTEAARVSKGRARTKKTKKEKEKEEKNMATRFLKPASDSAAEEKVGGGGGQGQER